MKEWVAGKEPVSYVKDAKLIVFRLYVLKTQLFWWGPYVLSRVYNLRENFNNLLRIQAMFFDQLREKNTNCQA